MRAMQSQSQESRQWAVFTYMRGVLCSAGAVNEARQASGVGDACGHRATAGEPWPGARAGVRAPEAWETPLSVAEVPYLAREGWAD